MGSAEEMVALPFAHCLAKSPCRDVLRRRYGKVDAAPAQMETRYKHVFHRHLMHKIAVEHLIYW